MKNSKFLPISLLLALGMLAACGGSGSSEAVPTSEGGETSTSSTEEENPSSSESSTSEEVAMEWPADFQAQIDALFESRGITDELPGIPDAVSYELFDQGASAQIAVELDDYLDVVPVIGDFQAALLEAGFADLGEDEYGDKTFASPNEQYNVNAWEGQYASTTGQYDSFIFIDITGLPGSSAMPNDAIAEYFGYFDVEIDPLPEYDSAADINFTHEIDTESSTLIVYINYPNGTTNYDEMVAYVEQLGELGWTATIDSYGDYDLVLDADPTIQLYIGDYGGSYGGYVLMEFAYNPDYIDVDALIAQGYATVNGWPTDLVAEVLDESSVAIEGVNLTGTWYALAKDNTMEDGVTTYKSLVLYTEGLFGDALIANLEAAGLTYNAMYGIYTDAEGAVEIQVHEGIDYSVIAIYGPTSAPDYTEAGLLALDPELVKVTGFPMADVQGIFGMSGENVPFAAVNEAGEWYEHVKAGQGYSSILLIAFGDHTEEAIQNLEAAGFTYLSTQKVYYKTFYSDYAAVSVSYDRGVTILNVVGPIFDILETQGMSKVGAFPTATLNKYLQFGDLKAITPIEIESNWYFSVVVSEDEGEMAYVINLACHGDVAAEVGASLVANDGATDLGDGFYTVGDTFLLVGYDADLDATIINIVTAYGEIEEATLASSIHDYLLALEVDLAIPEIVIEGSTFEFDASYGSGNIDLSGASLTLEEAMAYIADLLDQSGFALVEDDLYTYVAVSDTEDVHICLYPSYMVNGGVGVDIYGPGEWVD